MYAPAKGREAVGSVRTAGIASVVSGKERICFEISVAAMYGCHFVLSSRPFIRYRGYNTRIERRAVDNFLLRRTTLYNHARCRLCSPSITSHRGYPRFGRRGGSHLASGLLILYVSHCVGLKYYYKGFVDDEEFIRNI